jgi:hypothetical protein
LQCKCNEFALQIRGEKLGSGMIRIQTALRQNGNPPYSISATNFFSIRFLPRVQKDAGLSRSPFSFTLCKK